MWAKDRVARTCCTPPATSRKPVNDVPAQVHAGALREPHGKEVIHYPLFYACHRRQRNVATANSRQRNALHRRNRMKFHGCPPSPARVTDQHRTPIGHCHPQKEKRLANTTFRGKLRESWTGSGSEGLSGLPLPLIVDHHLSSADGDLKVCNLPKRVIGRNRVGIGRSQDQDALGSKQPGAKSVEFFGHGDWMAGRVAACKATSSFRLRIATYSHFVLMKSIGLLM